jgi:hypothetical protein
MASPSADTNKSSGGIPSGAIAGAVVGVLGVFLFTAFVVFFMWRRKARNHQDLSKVQSHKSYSYLDKHELTADERFRENRQHELDDDSVHARRAEVDGRSFVRAELSECDSNVRGRDAGPRHGLP